MRIEDYRRDWKGAADTPFAKQSFGSVVAAPLIFADEVMGVLFVAVGSNGKRFDRDELRLLELLGPQAAVAITNSRLFERQSALTGELESAKNQMETLLASTENPVIALNRRFEVIFANAAAVALFGGWLSTGQSIRNLAPPSTMPGDPLQALRELHRRGAYTYELLVRDRTFLCHVALLGRLQPRGYVAVLNDISQLKELDRLKNQMIRMTSHDLKNPLAAAMFPLTVAGEEIFTDEMQRDIATIWAQLQRMNRIISGILDLERVQSGTPLYDECAIEKIVHTAVHEFEAQASKKDVELGTVISEDLPMIIGDHQQLTQAVCNLVENAVKFTGTGGKVTVTASAVDDCVVINVADTGIGIPRDAQSRLFERFYRANHPGVEAVTGTGLGLSLVKAVVDAHKGRIWLESEVGKGTSIHMALPVRQSLPTDSRKVTTS
jgi:signal transduction histidine kinase